MARTRQLDEFYFEVSRGNQPGHRAVFINGFSDTVGAAETTLWPFNGVYVFPTIATIVQVASTSANDTAAGTGARTVTIQGLDANYNEISETITLNGQTPVSSTLSYLRINITFVLTAGSGGANAGVLYVGTGTFTAGVPAVKLDIAPIGSNYTQVGVYTVPAGNTLIFLQSANSVGQTKEVIITFAARVFGGVFQKRRNIVLFQSVETRTLPIGAILPEKSDLDIRSISAGAANGNVYSTLDAVLVNNNFRYLG